MALYIFINSVNSIYFCYEVCNCEKPACGFLSSMPLMNNLIHFEKESIILHFLLENLH